MSESEAPGLSGAWQNLRLGQKVSLTVVASLIPLVLLGIQVANFSGRLVRDQLLDNVGLVAQVEAERVSGRLEDASGSLDKLATSTALNQLIIQQNDSNTIAGSNVELKRTVESEFANLEQAGLRGLEIRIAGGTSNRAGMISSQTDLEANLVERGEDQRIGSVFFIDGRPYVSIVRVVGTGTTRSGLGASIVSEWDLLEVLGEGLELDSFGEGTEMMLLMPQADGSFRVVTSSDLARVSTSTTLIGQPVVGEALVLETEGYGGRDAVQASARVEDPVWITVIEADPDRLFAPLDAIRIVQIAMFVGAGLVLLLVVAFSLRSFVRRLARVTALAEAVADGDLTVRTGEYRLDELGRLAMAFDDMASALAQDIARREQVEAQLAYSATHDALTGLPNRPQLVAELDRLLVESEELISVLFVDLDGFKAVNDRLGHGAGDELLVRVSDRLRGVLRPSDFVARLGGDEFVVVLRGLGLLEAERMAERIVSALELPFIVTNDECQISASIGVSSANEDRSPERLIKEADIAMYRAKALGKGRAIRVTDEALNEVDERMTVLGELREAVNNNQLELLLWPVGDLRDGSLHGMEASVRWNHPERGLLPPAEFLPLAMSSGFAGQIDEWVIEASIEQFADWLDEGLPVGDLEMAFNLTTEMFLSPRSRQLIANELTRFDLRPVNFRVEIPESTLRSDGTVLREVFNTYRAMGMPVTLDKFGSDYANLDRLPRFAIDAVKIDLALISDLSNRLSSRALVSSLITLAQTAGLRIAAAGVDDELLREQVLELGCAVGQGLWLSHAVTPNEFAELLRSRFFLDAG